MPASYQDSDHISIGQQLPGDSPQFRLEPYHFARARVQCPTHKRRWIRPEGNAFIPWKRCVGHCKQDHGDDFGYPTTRDQKRGKPRKLES